jgi:hypothetical protein
LRGVDDGQHHRQPEAQNVIKAIRADGGISSAR